MATGTSNILKYPKFFDMAMSFIDAEGESLMFDPTAATPEQSNHLETMMGWHPHDIKSYQ